VCVTYRRLLSAGNSPANGESGDFGTHSIAGGDLDAEVVEGAAVARIFQQHQFEWGFGTQLVTRQAHR
jgi:hypothetical protein